MEKTDIHELFAEKLKAAIKREGISQRRARERLMAVAEDLSQDYGDPKYKDCLDVSFQTFKKILQGQFLEKRLFLIAEIASVAFSMEGVGEEDYTDAKVDLAAFKALLGLQPDQNQEPVPAADKLRQVRKVLFLIKARSQENTPLLLNYLSSDWTTLLVPNANIPKNENDEALVKLLLAERLAIDTDSISLDYRPDLKARYSTAVKKTGDPDKARDSGPWANYTFLYCPVKITRPADFMLQPSFETRGVVYHWATLNGLKADGMVRRLNNDVLAFLSRVYDSTLFHLPASFQERIDTKG